VAHDEVVPPGCDAVSGGHDRRVPCIGRRAGGSPDVDRARSAEAFDDHPDPERELPDRDGQPEDEGQRRDLPVGAEQGGRAGGQQQRNTDQCDDRQDAGARAGPGTGSVPGAVR